jgi:hypothetical protein
MKTMTVTAAGRSLSMSFINTRKAHSFVMDSLISQLGLSGDEIGVNIRVTVR